MARKAAQKKEVNNDGKELFEALKLLEAEKGIPVDFMIDKIKKAIATACKNSYGNEDVVIDMDPESGKFDVFLRKEIVEEVENPNREIALEIVKQYDPRAEIGGFVRHRLDTKQFGRVAAQTARNIIRQGIRDSERDQMMPGIQGSPSGACQRPCRARRPEDRRAVPEDRQGRSHFAEGRAGRHRKRQGRRPRTGLRCRR